MSQEQAKAYVDLLLGNIVNAAGETIKTEAAINRIRKK